MIGKLTIALRVVVVRGSADPPKASLASQLQPAAFFFPLRERSEGSGVPVGVNTLPVGSGVASRPRADVPSLTLETLYRVSAALGPRVASPSPK
jgi:hypothetical protein